MSRLYVCFTFMTYVFTSECVLTMQKERYVALPDSEMRSSIRTMPVPSKCSCGHVCADDKECVSFSYNNATELCKLNDNDPFIAPLDVVESDGSVLYHLKECEAGWEVYKHTCYIFSLTFHNWESSKSYCESIGTSLVKVENEGEHQFIRQRIINHYNTLTQRGYFWIGARYNVTAGEHRWVDNTEITFDGWGAGEPGLRTGCVDYLVHTGWLWHSASTCSEALGPSICEKGRAQMC